MGLPPESSKEPLMLDRARCPLSLAVLPALVAGSLLVAAPAMAGGGDAVLRTGSCSQASDWKTKAKADNGRIEFQGEVDSNRIGQTWRWKVRHNGMVAARGTGTTAGPSGSFDISRRLHDAAGTDRFVFRAVNSATGEVCRGTLAF